MSSRYKLRAWDKEWKEMQMVRDIYFDTKSGEVEYFITKGNFATYTGYPKTHVLMQCTGLKDKNGVDIYEGDIVKVSNITDSFVTHVYWGGKEYSAFDLHYKYIPTMWFSTWFYDSNVLNTIVNSATEKIEVIGNVYENRKLLDEQ